MQHGSRRRLGTRRGRCGRRRARAGGRRCRRTAARRARGAGRGAARRGRRRSSRGRRESNTLGLEMATRSGCWSVAPTGCCLESSTGWPTGRSLVSTKVKALPRDGDALGLLVGCADGLLVGELDGLADGPLVGVDVGGSWAPRTATRWGSKWWRARFRGQQCRGAAAGELDGLADGLPSGSTW